jgi:predicted extracellular nuclease
LIRSLVFACLALTAPALSQSRVVISQVYGGGGNAGSTYRNDFFELFNAGDMAQSLNGWSVQYAASAGATWQVTNLSGSIQPGHYYLVQESQGPAAR